jgi:hypothetical protein
MHKKLKPSSNSREPKPLPPWDVRFWEDLAQRRMAGIGALIWRFGNASYAAVGYPVAPDSSRAVFGGGCDAALGERWLGIAER